MYADYPDKTLGACLKPQDKPKGAVRIGRAARDISQGKLARELRRAAVAAIKQARGNLTSMRAPDNDRTGGISGAKARDDADVADFKIAAMFVKRDDRSGR